MQYPNRIIEEGEKDKDVTIALQQKLTENGLGEFKGLGVFGPKTTAAVKQFQATHRDQFGHPLKLDGKVGSITWAALFGVEYVPAHDSILWHEEALPAKAIEVARSQIGIMEAPPGSNSGPQVDEYLLCADCTPGCYWCASFVYWCFDKAAKALDRNNPVCRTAGCLYHWNNSSGKKIPAKDAMNNPSVLKSGQIFIMDFGKGMGHTGLIESVEGGFIHTIEGNSNNDGSRNGIGVFRLTRKIGSVNKGFIEYS